MKIKIKINLDVFTSIASGLSNFDFLLSSPNYIYNNSIDEDRDDFSRILMINPANNVHVLQVWERGTYQVLDAQTTSDILAFSLTGNYIECNIDTNPQFSTFPTDILYEYIEKGIVELMPEDKTIIYLYKQNSENNKLSKSLTFVDIIDGKFNHSIGVKSLNIDVVDLEMNFNYVYIPSLSRYYYVDSVEIVSANVRRLMLKEDVLMSWQSLIRQQSAFVDRQENTYDPDIVDDAVTYSYDKFINTEVITLYTNIYENTGNDKLNFVIESVGG